MQNITPITLPLLPYLCKPSTILGLVLVGELLSFVLMLANSGAGFSWPALGSISLAAQWIILSSAFVLCQSRSLLNNLQPMLGGLAAYTVCLSISALVVYLAQLITFEPFDFSRWLKGFLITAIFSGILLRYLYLQQQLSNQQQAELGARLQSLQSRIKPHFLFNSMNTIASLITVNPSAAEKAVEDLSRLFRSSLQAPGLVKLEDEIDLCRRYIAIEHQRLAERLTMVWNMTEPLPSFMVPSLFLQPLLENAIIHGIQKLSKGGEIHLSILSKDKSIQIMVENPVPDINVDEKTKECEHGNQIALDNIQSRLQLHYGSKASIKSKRYKHSFSVKIELPLTE
ncbi:MAG: two-component system sensor histidine kinase AlgZ [Cellvibrionaceae bacterium]|jgi:two-component system sensor histidine kinase AlgZ